MSGMVLFSAHTEVLTQSQVRQGKWHSATEMLGESNPFRDSGRNCPQGIHLYSTKPSCPGKSGPAIPNVDGGIKVGAHDLVTTETFSHWFR